MPDITFKIESEDMRKSYFSLAGLLELDEHIEDSSEKGFNLVEAEANGIRLHIIGDKKRKFDANYNYIELGYSDIKDKNISSLLKEILPIIKDSKARVYTIEMDVPTETISDALFRIVSSNNSGNNNYQFTGAELKKYSSALSAFAKTPDLGLLKYTTNQVPHQSATFRHAENPKNISLFFERVKILKHAPLREILREGYVSHCTTLIKDGKEFDRALAYMASQAMGTITESTGLECMGMYNVPSLGLSFNITTSARAVAYLVWQGVDTPESLYRFIGPFHQDLVGTHTYKWNRGDDLLFNATSSDQELGSMEELDKMSESLGIAPSAQPLPEIKATIHYTRVHYPPFHTSPSTEKRRLDQMVDLGILKYSKNKYMLNES